MKSPSCEDIYHLSIGLDSPGCIFSDFYLWDGVCEELEMARSSHEWVELTERSRCGISRIREELFSYHETFAIHMIECTTTHHHFSTDFHTRYIFEGSDIFREILYLCRCECDILSLDSTPTSDSLSECAVLIDNSQSESIILRLDIVVKFFWAFVSEYPIDASLEITHIIECIRIIERYHRILVCDFLELLGCEYRELRSR